MLSKCTVSGALAIALLGGTLHAQTTVTEVEPNGTKAEATPATGLVAGDILTGTTTGTTATVGVSTLTSADTWVVQTAALPLGIYRHTLAITTTGTAGHSGTIRGLLQANGVISTTDTAFQTSSTTTPVPRSNTWYAFGKQEQTYWRVTGTTTTTAAYTATLSTQPITPLVVTGAFVPGNITVTTAGQGHTTDTEVYVYDGNLNPIPLGHNDGSASSSTVSTVTVNLPAGVYYVAVGVYNTSNNQSDLNPTEGWDDDALLDFPNEMACTSTITPQAVNFSVSDGVLTMPVVVSMTGAFDINWATFTVGNPTPPPTPFCFGDGSGTACPCANSGVAGNGCASSVNANGANLAATGTASVSADTLVLNGTGMPSSSALYFQGTTQVGAGAGGTFGDGLRCAGGMVIRLGTVTNVGGSSSYPSGALPAISVKGMDTPGAVREYQCWYRNAAAFCTPSTFNLTNGLEVTWTN